jgi:predicted alpha/beta-hydrolase family hydrolase
MASQAHAASPLPGVTGLAFLGFPLHPAGKPAKDRAQHLFDVQTPMLFLQGTRDDLAHLDQLKTLCDQLGGYATLKLLEHADHSFHVLARSGRTVAEVSREMIEALVTWIEEVTRGRADLSVRAAD